MNIATNSRMDAGYLNIRVPFKEGEFLYWKWRKI